MAVPMNPFTGYSPSQLKQMASGLGYTGGEDMSGFRDFLKGNPDVANRFLAQQDKDMQLLSYQILVDKFNEKYGDLSVKQKKVLREYINNVSNTNNLKELISSEVPHIKRTLRNKMRSIKDPVVRIKLKEVAKQANRGMFNKG